ncbi:YdaU family protein (plasmid) [Burkholderia vietnamiensis]|uniref:DUF1376 domain-containing protein n=1 Tax=Burkholderia vietnamiensis (strain G4 / LMG 22486) TaxID=269482 RepID=A4JTR0_BURVG|nr:hypothetical protein Bcep1808_6775 [Burkholderia vietnamiensis G4]MCB4350178.1 YdaU family protein [Burkholderia vietnamiensis]
MVVRAAVDKSPAFQFYARDFLSDENVAVMSNQALGAYVRLMCYAWLEGSIPGEFQKLARLAGESVADMEQIWGEIASCFDPHPELPNRFVQARLEREREKQATNREVRSAAGKIGADRRWNNELPAESQRENGNARSGAMASDGLSTASAPATASMNMHTSGMHVAGEAADGRNGTLFESDQSDGVVRPPRPADAIPACPQQEIIALYHELMPSNPRVLTWNKEREALLRTRWREMAVTRSDQLGEGYKTTEQGLAWWKHFLSHCGNSAFLSGRTPPRGDSAPFVASLEWIVRPKNFAKILEGNYHR